MTKGTTVKTLARTYFLAGTSMLLTFLMAISGSQLPAFAVDVQLPNPILLSASAGSVSGTIKVNFSAGFADQYAATTNGTTTFSAAAQALAIDTAGNIIYAGYYQQTAVKFRSRISRGIYSAESTILSAPHAFESAVLDSNNNIWTIGGWGVYRYSRTNGTLGSGAWTETLVVDDTNLCTWGDICIIEFDGQDDMITNSKAGLRFWGKTANPTVFQTSVVIDSNAGSDWDFSVKDKLLFYKDKSNNLRVVEAGSTYDFVTAAKYGGTYPITESLAFAIESNGLMVTGTRNPQGKFRFFSKDQGTSFTNLWEFTTGAYSCAMEFDPFGDLIAGCKEGTAYIRVVPKISAPSQTYTAKVYASDGTTLVKTVSNYVSGTDITGLVGSTTYKVKITANAATGYTASTESTALSATTATDPPSISSNTVSGSGVAGQTLTSSVTATGTVTRIWKRDGVAISGATASTYTLVAADVGALISVSATATNSAGSSSNTSSNFGPILASAPTIQGVNVSGTLIKGQTLTASASGITGIPSPSLTYAWNRDGTPIADASAATYLLTTADIGTVISATIIVTNGAGSSSATSGNTAVVSKITPSISLSLPNSINTGTYGSTKTITAAVTTPGTVQFLVGGLQIPGCQNVVAVSTATCSWIPDTASAFTTLTANFMPSDSANFTNLSDSGLLIVNVGKAVLNITASSHTVSFGSSKPTITPGYSGFLNGDSENVLSNLLCTTTYTPSTDVGTASSSCSGATSANYSFNYTPGVITIQRGSQNSSLTISTLNTTYGTPLTLSTVGGNGAGATSFIVDSGPCTVISSTLTPTGAGTCMVTATKAASGNFLATSSTSTAIIISPKNLTIGGLTGTNKVFDHGVSSSATGTPSLNGVIGSDVVHLEGTPSFKFANDSVGTSKIVSGSGYSLAGPASENYTLTQPTVTANITKKPITVSAGDVVVAFGAGINGGFTTSGLLANDEITATTFSYSGTGTTTAPTSVGAYTITPTNAVFGTGSISNYEVTYVPGTLTILAKYTTTLNGNGGQVSSTAISSFDFVVGDAAVNLPTPTRANFTFVGWFTSEMGGTKASDSYTPNATSTLWAHWIQNSLFEMGQNTKILTITTLAGVGNRYEASADGGTISIQYPADALPAGTVIDAYLLSDTSNAANLIGSGNTYVLSLVLAWLAQDGTVPSTADGKPISMTITNSTIKRGAKIYSIIGSEATLIGTARENGTATVSLTDDPQIFIAITKPDAPTGVQVTIGTGSALAISWNTPASDGGSAITQYTVTSSTGETCTTSTTSCLIAGVNDGLARTFVVTATNEIGESTVCSGAWLPGDHRVTYALGGGSSSLPTQSDVTTGLGLTLAAVPTRAGYTFAGWSDGTEVYAAGSEYIMGEVDVTLTATWLPNASKAVTFSAGGGSGTVPATAPTSLLVGQSFILPANTFTKSGFIFAGWSDGTTIRPAGTTILIGDTEPTFTATWTAVTPNRKTFTLIGFQFERSRISASMYSSLRSWLAANTDLTRVTCTGYTGFNQNKLSPSQLFKLGKARAVNVCNFLKKLKPTLVITIAKPVASKSKNPAIRRSVILG